MLSLTTIIHIYNLIIFNNHENDVEQHCQIKNSPGESEIHWCECHGILRQWLITVFGVLQSIICWLSNYIFKSIKAKWIDDGLLLTLFSSFLPSFLIQFIICFKKNMASKEDKAPAPNFNVL